jgi:ABC-2 type transport system permease protein
MSGAGALARAEILRSRSGSSFPVLLAYAILIPVFALNMPGTTDRLGGLDDAPASRFVFGFAACAALGACFYGSYAYTRETYYHSLDRTLLLGSRDAILVAKALAGAVSGAVFGVVAVVGWWPISAVVLATAGRRLTPDITLLSASLGVVLACALSGVLGVGVGYAVRNYYACIPIARSAQTARTASASGAGSIPSTGAPVAPATAPIGSSRPASRATPRNGTARAAGRTSAIGMQA